MKKVIVLIVLAILLGPVCVDAVIDLTAPANHHHPGKAPHWPQKHRPPILGMEEHVALERML